MRHRNIVIAAALGLGGSLVLVPAALAQSSSSTQMATARPAAAAVDNLPLGEQKIARALWEAQAATQKLTVDEIATLKLSGTSWGEIFADFLMRDLVPEKKLKQIMRVYKTELDEAARRPK